MAASHPRLRWHTDRQAYELEEEGRSVSPPFPFDDNGWFAWLEGVSSFSFQGQQGQLTVRKEARPRGAQYWYAYRRIGPKMAKKYLGRSADLTLARLEEVAAAFPSAAGSTAEPAEPSHAIPMDEQRLPHDPLLATKLHPPRPRSRLVSRAHLVERLQQGMESALTLISAPAGFGKTTLLAQWLAESGTPVAWLSLEPGENEPIRFFSYFLASLQTLHPQLGTTARALLETSPGIALERVLALLINDVLESVTDPFALVLDDYHVIETETIHGGVAFLLEHLPPQMHLVMATRADPPLPLMRLRARGQLTEVRAADLRFDLDEAREFLHTVMRLDLPAEALAALDQRTEGWIAGLQLAALSLSGRSDVAAFLRAFTGSHRFILDYLTAEVFSRQPREVQSFLLATSILERLSGPLCDAVTGQPESQSRLAALEQANLFVVALDDEQRWYRYHHLFAEVLRTRLQQNDPSLVPHLHVRASRWYEQQRLFAEAVQHAFAAADIERAADLIERIDVNSWAGLGMEVQRVLGWLARLPESFVCTRPLLCIIHAIALMFTNRLEEAEARLQMAERCLDGQPPSEQTAFLRGHIAATRGVMARFSGDLARSVAQAQQALVLLPHPERTPGPISRLNVAQAFLADGDVTAPQERLALEMVTVLKTSENQSMTMRSLTNLAQLQAMQGRLRQAAATFEQAAQVAPRPEDLQAITGSLVYFFGLADILREWNELDQAAHLLEQGMELVEGGLTAEGHVLMLGYTTLARLYLARGQYPQALAALDTFTHLAGARHLAPSLMASASAWRAHMELMQGNLLAAKGWAEHCGLTVTDDDLRYQNERAYLTLLRIGIVEGRENPSASRWQEISHRLERRLRDAEAKARRRSVLELLLLEALAWAAQRERNAACSALSRALSLAEPQGYVRLFVDEGTPVRDLLRHLLARGVSPHSAATLLAAFGEPAGEDTARFLSHPDGLIEPLTKREQEVLQLLAEGASNREIAQRLIVSTGTVKKYVYNICGKLGVQSRTQALARARSLHLL
ncbi:MAG TPA: LuxR C-terminal-related transcriptional regulator [Ktedonobacteraceae bacterium]|nr:LuxR C-terminal-related transcriptional regulator [Ktedonobacteraceae bacterium]